MEAYRNLDAQKAVSVAVKNGDPSSLRPDEIQTYETMMKYLETGNPADGWGLYTTFAEESSYAEVVELVDNGWYLFDEYHGIPTPTMTEKGSTLTKMEVEAFTKIILGADISEFDKFVEDWKSLGGDAITAEINEAAGE
jgi:putative aldouronate transport system substrate-binding protein